MIFGDICEYCSGKFSLVQNFAEMRKDSIQRNFCVFFFANQMRDTLITPYQ